MYISKYLRQLDKHKTVFVGNCYFSLFYKMFVPMIGYYIPCYYFNQIWCVQPVTSEILTLICAGFMVKFEDWYIRNSTIMKDNILLQVLIVVFWAQDIWSSVDLHIISIFLSDTPPLFLMFPPLAHGFAIDNLVIW